jgi:enterochelin esterase-like enzyme
MLHAHRSEPAAFGALFLQSGSFFHHRYFRHELAFEHVDRIRRFMDRVHPTGDVSWAVPVSLTCGKVEMNLASNRALALAMRRQGYDVALTEVRDAHNWIAWRDAWTPHLVDLLQKVWT